MNRPTIIVASQGAGKSLNAPKLLESLGCISIVEEWNGQTPLSAGELAFTNAEVESHASFRVMTLEQALSLSPRAAN